MKTFPLASMRPKMLLMSPPVTRFRTIAAAEGWMNWTDSVVPRLNACQLMARFWLCWAMTVVTASGVAIVPAPPAISPPVGPASAQGLEASAPSANAIAAIPLSRVNQPPS